MNGFESDWTGLSQSFFAKWLNPRRQNSIWKNSRWLPTLSSVRMNELESAWIRLSQSFVQHGWIQYGRIQDGCHYLVSQIDLVWVRVWIEGECFWVIMSDDNKVSESMMAVSESNMAEFKMAAIIKWSHNEWVWVRLNWFESEFFCKIGWTQDGRIQYGRIQDGCHH